MSPADRVALLRLGYGVCVELSPDGEQLTVDGPAIVVRAAYPTLVMHRAVIVEYLKGAAC